jgi:hypothetical protein
MEKDLSDFQCNRMLKYNKTFTHLNKIYILCHIPTSTQTADFEKSCKVLYEQQVMGYNENHITILSVGQNTNFYKNPFSSYGYEI